MSLKNPKFGSYLNYEILGNPWRCQRLPATASKGGKYTLPMVIVFVVVTLVTEPLALSLILRSQCISTIMAVVLAKKILKMVFVEGPVHQLAAVPLGGAELTYAGTAGFTVESSSWELVSPRVPETVLNQRIPMVGAWLKEIAELILLHSSIRLIEKNPWKGYAVLAPVANKPAAFIKLIVVTASGVPAPF